MDGDFRLDYICSLQQELMTQSYSQEEVASCLCYAEQLLNRNLPVLFDDQHVKEVLQLNKIQKQTYHTFFLYQKGKNREITAPSLLLKYRQRWILDNILSYLRVSDYAHGFVKGRSIKTNAMLHAQHEYVLCMDIEDFFPSIQKDAVVRIFVNAGYSKRASLALGDICCYQNVLPQGAPTSPYLANLVFYQLDEQLGALAKKFNAVYTRYADDLTFSGNSPLDGLVSNIIDILEKSRFKLNKEKSKSFLPGQPKKITGLVVQNGAIHIPRYFKRSLKQEIYYCQKFGVIVHLENRNAEKRINYREYLYGKAYNIRMIEPGVGEKYLEELDKIQWPICYL